MEKAAFRLAGENHLRLSIILPSMIVGPVLMPHHEHKGLRQLMQGETWHERIPNDSMSMIDVRDLAALFLAAMS